jgi:hypothetical protein
MRAQGVLNRLGSETLLSSAVLTDLGNTAFSIASEHGLPVDAALQRGLKDACLAFMGQEAAPGLQRLVHVVSSIYFEELVFSRVQSEISRAYVAEMENELEKNPRGAAQAVMQLQQQQQDDMRRLQMERFRRLLVNFDDDVAGSPGNDDDADDGEVQVRSARSCLLPAVKIAA